jgi:hypothetical protein
MGRLGISYPYIEIFYIRRSVSNLWKGKWVIAKATARPVSRIVQRNQDAFSNFNDPRAQGKEVQQARETLRNKMKRADHKRFLAWT